MIDWQVMVDSRDPDGWDRHRDGCRFPDFDYQEYLLPYFDIGDVPIDPYGATGFHDGDLQRLRKHLHHLHDVVEGKPETWSLTESANGKDSTIRLERAKILALLDKTLEMIDFALSHGSVLIFRGD